MAEHYAYLFKTDGTKIGIDSEPTLETLQKYVGGNIEYLPIRSKFGFIGNEDGLHLELKENKSYPRFLGDIVVVNEFDGKFHKFVL